MFPGWGGPGGWFGHMSEVLWGIASFFVGLIVFAIWVAIIVLLVRFLLIGTRAAKAYLRSQGQYDGVLPQRSTVAPTTTPSTVAKPAPRTPRAPKA